MSKSFKYPGALLKDHVSTKSCPVLVRVKDGKINLPDNKSMNDVVLLGIQVFSATQVGKYADGKKIVSEDIVKNSFLTLQRNTTTMTHERIPMSSLLRPHLHSDWGEYLVPNFSIDRSYIEVCLPDPEEGAEETELEECYFLIYISYVDVKDCDLDFEEIMVASAHHEVDTLCG